MVYNAGHYDVIVVGAGHAGCEAGIASAKLGAKTLMVTLNLDMVAFMPCNPSLGGPAKGIVIREIDALGGVMGKVIDKTHIQMRMLNTAKGPAVRALRAQADKPLYIQEMKDILENQENLTLKQAMVNELIIEDGVCKGILTETNAAYYADSVVITTGTFMRGKVLIGDLEYESGPNNQRVSIKLSENLEELGFDLTRYKTGTPPRVNSKTIDYSKAEIQPGDEKPQGFSYETTEFITDQIPCWLTHTNQSTHDVINENLTKSAMYSGMIKGTGPRYCPSIEDKIVRFADKKTHQIFIEPEGITTKEMYVQGASSTLPQEVQMEMYKTIIGLEDVKFMRPGHGIEYDSIDSTILKRNLEHKDISNLFFAGQINGSSGYEEAAAQGLMAGINAVQNVKGKEPFILDRSEGYIGVLIDDLVTKGTEEPYRMMTSRAEYRLTLRQDNADLRLTKKGYELGLVSEERYKLTLEKEEAVKNELERLKGIDVNPTEDNNSILKDLNTTTITTPTTVYELIRRPELNYEVVEALDPDRKDLLREIKLQVETQIKYEGYIKKQMRQVEQFKKLENRRLEIDFDYTKVKSLSNEALQKLTKIKPESVGQASRISGVSPSDINVLIIHLEHRKRNEKHNG